MSKTPTARATLLVLVAAACFGSIAVLTVIARQGGAPLMTILAWRYLIGSLGLMLVSGGPSKVRLPRDRTLRLLLAGGIGQAIVTGSSLASLDYIPASTLAFLFYTYPAWITLIAAVRRTEPLTPVRAVALALSLGGIALIVGNPFATSLPAIGLALALGAALCYAIYVPLLDRLGAGIDAAISSTWITGGACVIFSVGALATGQLKFAGITSAAWLATLAMAVFSTVVAFIAFLRGLATLGPVRTSIISTVEPFWTTMLGAVALGQPIGPTTIAGGACIAAAVALLQLRSGTTERREP